MSLFRELKRRGVFQAGLAYIVFAWLMVQVSDIILPTFEAPAWTMKAIILVLLALFFIGAGRYLSVDHWIVKKFRQ